MRHLGYRFFLPGQSWPPARTLCTPCYARLWAGLGKPSPQARAILGIRTVTLEADAIRVPCDQCGTHLDAPLRIRTNRRPSGQENLR